MVHGVQNWAVERRIGGGYLLQIAVVLVAYFVAGKLGQATTNIRSSNLGPVWPASGIALAAILIGGYRLWLGVAAAGFLVAFSSPVPLAASLGQAIGATAAALTGAFLLHRIANFDRSLLRLSDALSLIVLGGFGSAVVSASVGVFVLYANREQAYSRVGAAWLIYWLGDATGVLLVTPLVLRFTDFLKLRDRGRFTEVATLLLFLVSTCVVIFGDFPSIPIKLHVMAFAVLPFIMWAAIRFGVGATALSILIVAAIATIETALGSGPFASNTTFVNAVLLDVFFAVLSVTGLSLASVIAEREQAEREREQAVGKQAVMEERLRTADTLRESEEKLREYEKAVEGAEEMIAVVDREYRYLIANRQFLKMRNMTKGQVVGHFAYEVVNEEVFESVVKPKLDECLQGMVVRYETKYLYPGLGERDILVSYFPIEGANGIDRVACIVQDITDRKAADEARFRHATIVESSDDAIISGTLDGIIVSWNAGAQNIYGYTEAEAVGKPITILAPFERSDEENRILETLREGGRIEHFETTRVTKTGKRINVSLTVSPIKDSNGRTVGISGIARDITERKLSEKALAEMTRSLIEAQEQERARIGRELHDDIAQRLAMLAIELEQLQHNPSEVQSRVEDLRNRANEISDDIQALSHELHSSKLEYLGLVGGMRSWCKEFGERQMMEINFNGHDMPSLPKEVSLCLFRVLQEALNNAAKHSQARRVDVQLWEDSEIHLVISDLGKGFDVDAALQGHGLGLTSMKERVRLVNGTIAMDSKPMGGTTIHVRVPMESRHALQRVAG